MRNLENGRILKTPTQRAKKLKLSALREDLISSSIKMTWDLTSCITKPSSKFSFGEEMVDNADLMKEGQYVEMMSLADEERVLTCELPQFVEMEVTYTEPAVKGDTASTNAQKAATLETVPKSWFHFSSTTR